MLYYTYVYLDPTKKGLFIYEEYTYNFEPFYVGKGKGERCRVHINNKRNSNMLLVNKCQKLKTLGLSPIIIKYDNLSETFSIFENGERSIFNIKISTNPSYNILSYYIST